MFHNFLQDTEITKYICAMYLTLDTISIYFIEYQMIKKCSQYLFTTVIFVIISYWYNKDLEYSILIKLTFNFAFVDAVFFESFLQGDKLPKTSLHAV